MRLVLVAIGLLVSQLAANASQEPKTTPMLVAPEGFAVDLIDSAPELLWPSAVHCLADGSLLVAEDPMDMVGPADQPIDRIWLYRWKPEGGFTRTLFAEKLFATFGLEEIDGAVYVMNMPHLTVLRDEDGDGVAERRRELLTDLGPPAPGWPGGFNDHIVSGLRYGMDGFLYVSVGDKGIPLAHGTDGRTLSLRGGGIVRVRPDGTELGVVARGLRNTLDVAMDAEGEMFTYDNTDDGIGWWTRLTHVVPGGYYGYAWDYKTQPQRVLPPMAEYGGGSPTGGLCKREGGWPAPYEGSLYFCEWGDGTLRRFEVEPDSGTFRVAAMEEFLSAGLVPNFRPTDVCESPDGRFLYVSDWGFGGWVSSERTGRLWRVRRADDDGLAPGGVTTRLTKDASLVDCLQSEGWRARLKAQEEIVRRADVKALEEALEAGGPGALHALHAVRALARQVSRTSLSIESLRMMLGSTETKNQGDPALMRAELFALAALTVASEIDEANGLISQLAQISLRDESDMRLRQDALALLVATPDGAWVEDPKARAMAWKTANQSQIGRNRWRRLAGGRLEPERFALFFTDGEQQTLEMLDAIEDVAWRAAENRRGAIDDMRRGPFEDLEACGLLALARGQGAGAKPAVRARALLTVAGLARVCAPWDGKWWSIAPAASPRPARTLDWHGTAAANATLGEALFDRDVKVRRAALAAIRVAADPRLAPVIRGRIAVEEDPLLRAELLDALGSLGSREDGPLFARLVRESQDPAERLRALRIGARLDPTALAQAAYDLASQEDTVAEVQSACLALLAEPGEREAHHRRRHFDLASRRSIHPAPDVRAAAATLLGASDPELAVGPLIDLARDPLVRRAALEALAPLGDPRAARTFAEALADTDPDVRSAARRAIARSRGKLRPALEGIVLRQELSGAVVRELRAIYTSYQPIAAWEILGPFAADSPEGSLDFAAPQAELSRASLAAKPAARREVVSARADGFVDLRALLTQDSGQTAYAFATIESAQAREVELRAGSDDQLHVWLNGERIHAFDGARSFAAEADRFRASLRAGANQLVLRIGQAAGDWGFAVAVPGEGRGPIFEIELPKQASPAEYAAHAARNAGDPARGETVVRDLNRSTCLRCHSIGAEGEQVGPSLAGLGARYTREEIVQSILFPSQRLAEGYAAVSIVTTDDQMLFGQIRRDDGREIELVDTQGSRLVLPREEVAEILPSKLSVMPEGLCHTMTVEEFADLVAWLAKN